MSKLKFGRNTRDQLLNAEKKSQGIPPCVFELSPKIQYGRRAIYWKSNFFTIWHKKSCNTYISVYLRARNSFLMLFCHSTLRFWVIAKIQYGRQAIYRKSNFFTIWQKKSCNTNISEYLGARNSFRVLFLLSYFVFLSYHWKSNMAAIRYIENLTF